MDTQNRVELTPPQRATLDALQAKYQRIQAALAEMEAAWNEQLDLLRLRHGLPEGAYQVRIVDGVAVLEPVPVPEEDAG